MIWKYVMMTLRLLTHTANKNEEQVSDFLTSRKSMIPLFDN
jgi:hypothetical protein